MAAAVWALKLFKEHLRGRRFILFTDHKPLQKVADAKVKTLNDLQALSLELDFITQHKQGIHVPADFLSRNPDHRDLSSVPATINALELLPKDLRAGQQRSPDLQIIQKFRATKAWPPYRDWETS